MQVLSGNHMLSALLMSILFLTSLPALASGPDETPTITLDQAVHFIGTDGSDVLANPGNYSVEAAQEWLRLIPGTKRRDALLIEAQPGFHDTKTEIPIVMSTTGTEPDATDVHVVQLLNPDGTRLVATGTYSSIPSQGFGATAQASASNDALSVTIDRTLQFPNPEGEDVLVPAGTYAVTVEAEQFTLTEGTGTPITIETTEWSHTKELPSPTVVFLPSEEGQIPQRHLLVLYYPDGKTMQAVGTDPILTSRGTGEVPGEYVIDPALVTFEQPVHFTAPNGTPVVVEPGTYTAEAAEQAIRLIPSEDSQEALLIEARQGTHDTPLEVLLALSIPGTTPKELDFHHLMLLLPTGRSLEATGSYSGIQTRGWFKKAFNTAKSGVSKGVNAVGNTAKQGANIVGSGAQQGAKIIEGGAKKVVSAGTAAAIQAGKGIEQGAKLTWDGTKWVVNKVGEGATIAVCYAMIGGMKAGKTAAGIMGKLIPTAISKQAAMLGKVVKDVTFQDAIAKKIDQAINANQYAIPEMKRIQGWMGNQANRAKLDTIFSVDNFCKDSIGTMDAKLKQLGLAPNFASVPPQVSPQASPQVQPKITEAMVPGAYRHNPVQNDWHTGSIVPDGAGLRWTNKAGASWHLTPDLANQRLLTGPDNPYFAQGLREFKLIISNGQVTGFQFAGGTYLRESVQVQPQTAIQSRGVVDDMFGKVGDPHFYMGYQITLDASYAIGVLGGIYGVTDFRGSGAKYWFLGAQGGITAGAGGAVQAIFFPKVKLDSFEGSGWGIGGSLGKAVVFAADVIFDEDFKEVQGFGVGVGAGVGPTKMVGDIAVSWDYSWKY